MVTTPVLAVNMAAYPLVGVSLSVSFVVFAVVAAVSAAIATVSAVVAVARAVVINTFSAV